MNALTFILINVGVVLLLLGLWVVLALVLANQGPTGWHFVRIEFGNILFFNVGDNLRNIWPNVGGYKLSRDEDPDGRQWLVRSDDDENRLDAFFRDATIGTKWFQKWMWNTFGIRFGSFFYPHSKAAEFNVDRKRLIADPGVSQNATFEEQEMALRNRIIVSPEPPTVPSLLFNVPRPIYIEGLELPGDNAKINVLLLAVFQSVIPEIPVYIYKGEFFALLDAALEAVMVDFLATHQVAVTNEGTFIEDTYDKDNKGDKEDEVPLDKEKEETKFPAFLTYSHWTKISKGDGNPAERYFRQLNASPEYYKQVKASGKGELLNELNRLTHGEPEPIESRETRRQLPHGLIPRFGFGLVSVRMVGWTAHKDTRELATAMLQKQIKFLEAEGVREEAYGERDRLRALGVGEQSRFDAMVAGLIAQGITSENAAGIVREYLRTGNVRDSGLTTWVEGGASSSILVPASNTPPTSPDSTSDSPN